MVAIGPACLTTGRLRQLASTLSDQCLIKSWPLRALPCTALVGQGGEGKCAPLISTSPVLGGHLRVIPAARGCQLAPTVYWELKLKLDPIELGFRGIFTA